MEILDDEYGRESVQLRVYYRGPHRSGGSPRAIRLDVNRAEVVVFPIERRRVNHDYSDAGEFGEIAWPCYGLAEVLTEKLRAVLGQRRFAVSRDLFDIHQLIRSGVDETGVRDALPAKLNVKDLVVTTVTADRMLSRKAAFLVDWTRNLTPLVQPAMLPEFEEAWNETTGLLDRVLAP
jgi:predicted nucleotidyltransferase component of viral defense system